jgi:hypothetical protein
MCVPTVTEIRSVHDQTGSKTTHPGGDTATGVNTDLLHYTIPVFLYHGMVRDACTQVHGTAILHHKRNYVLATWKKLGRPTPWKRILLEKLVVAQRVKKLSSFRKPKIYYLGPIMS